MDRVSRSYSKMDEHFRATLEKTVLKLNSDHKDEMKKMDKTEKTLKVLEKIEKKLERVEK